MIVKNLSFGDEAKYKVFKGIETLSRAVSSTLGASGQCVLLEDSNGFPTITKDGVTVADSIVLRDPIENMGCTLLKQAARKTVQEAGDGTTTATVLAHSILSNVYSCKDTEKTTRELKNGINKGVKKVVALSTDKASSPINLYGASKLASDKLFVASNSSYAGGHKTRFSVVRYGNVMGSRGSIIPFLISIKDNKNFPITDKRMTRFMITLEEGIDLVWHAFEDMIGGETYVKKCPSMKIIDIAKTISAKAKYKTIGIRPGEKLHEQMFGIDESNFTFEYKKFYKILPQINNWFKDPKRIKNGIKVREGFVYSSDNNKEWMTESKLKNWIKKNYA